MIDRACQSRCISSVEPELLLLYTELNQSKSELNAWRRSPP